MLPKTSNESSSPNLRLKSWIISQMTGCHSIFDLSHLSITFAFTASLVECIASLLNAGCWRRRLGARFRSHSRCHWRSWKRVSNVFRPSSRESFFCGRLVTNEDGPVRPCTAQRLASHWCAIYSSLLGYSGCNFACVNAQLWYYATDKACTPH